jgi:hypothetical protein
MPPLFRMVVLLLRVSCYSCKFLCALLRSIRFILVSFDVSLELGLKLSTRKVYSVLV